MLRSFRNPTVCRNSITRVIGSVFGQVVVGSVKKILALLDSGRPSLIDPGPSVGRRLSRAEYSHGWRI